MHVGSQETGIVGTHCICLKTFACVCDQKNIRLRVLYKGGCPFFENIIFRLAFSRQPLVEQ